MRRGNILPIALMAFAIVAFLFVLDYAVNGYTFPWSTNMPQTANINAVPVSSTNTTSPYPTSTQLFTSADLNIQFYYNTAGPEATGVKQIDDTVYVYPSIYKSPKDGQFVKVFTKDASDTLSQAITKRFLSGIATKDCFVAPLSEGDIGPTQSAAIIDWPTSLIDDNHPFGENSKCPKEYQKTSGARYFLTDSRDPTKLLFFSIGQYAITVDNVHTWQSTLTFVSPAADKTYTNNSSGLTFQYPDERITREYQNPFEVRIIDANDPDRDTPRLTGVVHGPGDIGISQLTKYYADPKQYLITTFTLRAEITTTKVANETAYRVTYAQPFGISEDDLTLYVFNHNNTTWVARLDLTGIAGSADEDFEATVKSISFTH